MISDALDVVDFNKLKPNDEASSNYHVIGKYDVSKYEELYLDIDLDYEEG